MKRVIVDVREPYEFAAGHVKGAINVPPADLMMGADALSKIPKEAELIVYCRTGSRSAVAIHILQSLGYTHVTNGINQQHVEAELAEGA